MTNRHMIFETAFGYCALVFRDNPFMLVRVLLPCSNKNKLISMIQKDMRGIAGLHDKATALSKTITAYFAGKNNQTEPPLWDLLDMGHLTPLHQEVLRITSEIPYGQVCSYQAIAQAVKRPRAYRFVGSCLSKNPFPIIIPCHRVVRSDLSAGNFAGGFEMKRKMIELEAKHAHERYDLQAIINYGSRKL